MRNLYASIEVPRSAIKRRRQDGALAQLGERFAGSEEVSGSIPLGSTKLLFLKHKFNKKPLLHIKATKVCIYKYAMSVF